MKYTLTICILVLVGLNSCAQNSDSNSIEQPIESEIKQDSIQQLILNLTGENLATRINTPVNYVRLQEDSNSYASYLRHLPLKPHG